MSDMTKDDDRPLPPVFRKFAKAISLDGFEPHLHRLLDDIKRVWSQEQYLPFTIVSRRTTDINYWQPTWDKTFRSMLSICGSIRNLVRLGYTEFLYVNENWVHQEPLPDGEMFTVMWRSRLESRIHACEIKHGKYRKYLHVIGQEWMPINLSNPAPFLNPWHTTKDIFDYWGVPEDQRDYDRLDRMDAIVSSFGDFSQNPAFQKKVKNEPEQEH